MTERLRLAVVQANPTVGDIAGNLALAKTFVLDEKDADLVVFPECFLSGYPLEDLVRRSGFRAQLRDAIAEFTRFVRDTNGPAVLMGTPVDGLDLPYNAALMFHPDGTLRAAHKRDLPNTDVFDEVRTFTPGAHSRTMPLDGFRLGVGICEEMWHPMVAGELAGDLASILIFINGSPFEDGKQRLRHQLARRRVQETGLPLIYVNLVGGQDEVVFDGASFAMNRHGQLVAQMPAFKDGVMRLELTRNSNDTFDIEPEAAHSAGTPYPERLDALYTGAMVALRDYITKNGFEGVVLGMSGGIDSALVAAIATDAIGPGRVHCRMMPSGYTSTTSVEDAAECAGLLGAEHRSISIAPAIAAYGQMLAEEFDGLAEDVTEENLQARARAMTLLALSNKFNWMVLATGNKSEMSVGYATLYGDMVGGYAILKDIYKTDVFALARWRNEHRPVCALGPRGPVIPERIITKPPTAELKEGQTDEQALGGYDLLDATLRALIEKELDPRAAALAASRETGKDVEPAYAQKIAALVKRAEWKRRQAPPGPKLTSRPFGKGWRYPITNKAPL